MGPLSPPKAAIRGVLFDVYGTLVHLQRPTRPYRQLLDIVRAQNPAISKERGARDVMCQSLGLADAARFYGVELSPVQKSALERDLDEELRSLRLFPEIPQVLRNLRVRGYRLGVCSNLAEPYVSPVAHLLGGMIDAAVWSCEAGAMKPDIAIYELASLRLGIAPAALLMVGDSYQADVEGARLAGFHALHLDRQSGEGDLATLEELPNRLDTYRQTSGHRRQMNWTPPLAKLDGTAK